MSDPLWEKGAAVELQKSFLHHPPHQVRDVDLMNTVAETPFKPITVE